jgi:hypothetical protein
MPPVGLRTIDSLISEDERASSRTFSPEVSYYVLIVSGPMSSDIYNHIGDVRAAGVRGDAHDVVAVMDSQRSCRDFRGLRPRGAQQSDHQPHCESPPIDVGPSRPPSPDVPGVNTGGPAHGNPSLETLGG